MKIADMASQFSICTFPKTINDRLIDGCASCLVCKKHNFRPDVELTGLLGFLEHLTN